MGPHRDTNFLPSINFLSFQRGKCLKFKIKLENAYLSLLPWAPTVVTNFLPTINFLYFQWGKGAKFKIKLENVYLSLLPWAPTVDTNFLPSINFFLFPARKRCKIKRRQKVKYITLTLSASCHGPPPWYKLFTFNKFPFFQWGKSAKFKENLTNFP